MFGIEELTKSTKRLEITLERLTSKLDVQNMLIREHLDNLNNIGLKHTKELLQGIRNLNSKKKVNKFIDEKILDIERLMK